MLPRSASNGTTPPKSATSQRTGAHPRRCPHRFIERWQFDVLERDAAATVRARLAGSLERHGFGADDRDTAEFVFSELKSAT
jgi:hypothetical protein